MKTKKTKQVSKVVRNYKAGLLDKIQQSEVEKPNKRQIRNLSNFFLEESLTDYEFNYQMRILNY